MYRQIANGAAASLLYIATVVIVSVLQLRLVVQMLPAHIAGVWLLFMSIGAYISFFDFGINPTISREISFFSAASDLSESELNRRIGGLLNTVRLVFRAIAICAGAISVIVGELILGRFAHLKGDFNVASAWMLFSLGASLNLVGGPTFAALFGLGHVAAEKVIRAMSLIVGLLLTIVFLKLGWGIAGLGVAWVLQNGLATLVAHYHLERRWPGLFSGRSSLDWKLAKRLVAPSLKLAAIQFGAILILQSANPIIALVIGTAAIPRYEAVAKIASTMMTLALLVVNSSTPFLSMSYAAGDLDQFRGLVFRNLRLGLGLMITLSAFVAVNGEHIVCIWLGSGSFAGYPVLLALLVMVLLEVHHVVFAIAAIAAGKIVFVWTAILSGVLNVGFAIFLAQRLGLLGVAIAVASAQLLTNNWYAPYVTIRFFKISTLKLLREVWLPAAALLITQLALNIVLKQLPWLGGSSVITVILNFVLGICIGAPVLWALVLHPSERARLLELLLQGWLKARIEHA